MADWHTLGQVNYRKWAVYEDGEMGWNMHGSRLNIADYTLYGAPFGGPLALTKVDSNDGTSGESVGNASLSSGSSATNSGSGAKILVYTASGKKISEIDLNEVKSNSDKIAGIGWSDQEQLIIVLEDGTVLIYDTFGRLIKKLSMVDSTYPVQILECVYWGDGVVAICSDFQLHAIDGLSSLELSTIRRYICVFCNKQLYTKKG